MNNTKRTEFEVKSPEDLGRIVKTRRKETGITQKQAAGMCNVGVRFLSDLENGKSTLEIGKIMLVLNGFGFQCMIRSRG